MLEIDFVKVITFISMSYCVFILMKIIIFIYQTVEKVICYICKTQCICILFLTFMFIFRPPSGRGGFRGGYGDECKYK